MDPLTYFEAREEAYLKAVGLFRRLVEDHLEEKDPQGLFDEVAEMFKSPTDEGALAYLWSLLEEDE